MFPLHFYFDSSQMDLELNKVPAMSVATSLTFSSNSSPFEPIADPLLWKISILIYKGTSLAATVHVNQRQGGRRVLPVMAMQGRKDRNEVKPAGSPTHNAIALSFLRDNCWFREPQPTVAEALEVTFRNNCQP